MSCIEYTNKFIQSANDELSDECTLGKTDDHYVKIKHEPIEMFEIEESYFCQQTDDKILSTAAAYAAITRIESELKFLCSLQVHNSDNTTLEPSIELPIQDTLFLQEILNSTQLSPSLNDDWLTDFPIDSFDQLLSTDPPMTYKDFIDMNPEQTIEYHQDIAMNMEIPSTTHDETTTSSGDSTSDTERDDVNRRGLKKSGGPVRKLARFGNKQVIKYSDEYHDRRVKNNEAVKKSRMKAKEKHKDTESKMTKLANENRTLSDRVDLLMKELQVLKSLYKELNQDLPSSAVKALERVNVH